MMNGDGFDEARALEQYEKIKSRGLVVIRPRARFLSYGFRIARVLAMLPMLILTYRTAKSDVDELAFLCGLLMFASLVIVGNVILVRSDILERWNAPRYRVHWMFAACAHLATVAMLIFSGHLIVAAIAIFRALAFRFFFAEYQSVR